jgi:hypothetical protein
MINKKYDSFYFLHIPKTGGSYFNEYISSQLKNIEILPTKDKHSGWSDLIKESTYIFSIIRDPIMFACSIYSHVICEKAGLLKDNQPILIQDFKSINLDKKYFFKWLNFNQWIYNAQSKSFLHSSTNDKYIIDDMIQKYIFNKNVDKELLYTRLNRVNLLIRHEDLYDSQKIYEKICKDLGINCEGQIIIDRDTFSNKASKSLYTSLTESDKAILEEMFALDMEIYHSNFFTLLD